MALLEVVRIVLGSLLVLVAPGLAWSFVFFPKTRPIDAPKDAPGVDWIERVAIAFGLSIALVPVSVFLLNYFLKVPINAATALLVVLLLTAGPLAYLWLERKGRLPWKRKSGRAVDGGRT